MELGEYGPWQRARVLKDCIYQGKSILKRGDLLWVEVGPPTTKRRWYLDKTQSQVCAAYNTNVLAPKGHDGHPLMACQKDKLELLPESSPSVALIAFEALFAGQVNLFAS